MQQVAERLETPSYLYDNRSYCFGPMQHQNAKHSGKKKKKKKIQYLCFSDWPLEIKRNLDLRFLVSSVFCI